MSTAFAGLSLTAKVSAEYECGLCTRLCSSFICRKHVVGPHHFVGFVFQNVAGSCEVSPAERYRPSHELWKLETEIPARTDR